MSNFSLIGGGGVANSNKIHFATSCAHFSDAHKQNDEFHFCLDINDEPIFDDCGMSDFSPKELSLSMQNEQNHSTISIKETPYSKPNKVNKLSRISFCSYDEHSFSVKMQHKRIARVFMQRQIQYNAKLLSICDEIKNLQGYKGQNLEFRFVLHPDIRIIQERDKSIILHSPNQKFRFLSQEANFKAVKQIPYLASYPKLGLTNILLFSLVIEQNRHTSKFILERID